MSIKGNKKPISTEQFINITTELGYNTSKVTTSSTVIDSYTAKKISRLECKFIFRVIVDSKNIANSNCIRSFVYWQKRGCSISSRIEIL